MARVGRKALADGPRPSHTIRCYDNEYKLIMRFSKMIRYDYDSAEESLDKLEEVQKQIKIQKYAQSLE